MTLWASDQEVSERFYVETLSGDQLGDLQSFGFCFKERFRAVLDDGTQLIVLTQFSRHDGVTVEDEVRFMHERAFEDASSYVAAAFDAAEYGQEALAPFGLEWDREQMERAGR